MEQRNAIVEEWPVPLQGHACAKTRLVVSRAEIFIEVGYPGFGVEGHIFEDAGEVSPFDELIAGSGGEGGSHLQILEAIVFEIGGGEPVEPFGKKEVELDRPARVSSNKGIGILTVDVTAVNREPELFAPGHDISQQAGIARVAVSGRLGVATCYTA